MFTMRRFIAPVVCVALSASLASAAESTLTADLAVHKVKPVDATVVLRSIANVERAVAVDDDTIRVWGDASRIAIARTVVDLIEKPADASETSVQLADGTTAAIAALRHASAIDVLRALRAKLGIRKVATIDADNSSSSILVRDSSERAQEALKLIAEMDGEGS
ncbi:MAG TPA: secretin N-terminal domain-containing protein [Thermoanaerobaculia bacterium]|nr:secretin N-terminal domain-containing protein [Thermoanaerobaculia bacterium]